MKMMMMMLQTEKMLLLKKVNLYLTYCLRAPELGYFDCTKYFRLFTDVVLNDNTESYLWALDVIYYMDGPFKLSELNYAVESLQLALSKNQEADKTPYYEKLLTFLLTQKENVS